MPACVPTLLGRRMLPEDAVGARHALMCRVAAEAGEQALGHWRRRAELIIEEKANPQDVVSRADRAVERAIREAVAMAFPEDAVLGEEFGAVVGRSGYTWVVDPIDGTAPFLAGHPTWCVAIALRRDDETVAAATAAPVTGELFAARRGQGMTVDGSRVTLDRALGIGNGQTAIGASGRSDPAEIAGIVERLMRRGGMFYRNGSGALMLAYVASGRLAGYVEPHMHAWDAVGGLMMVEEAGGRTAPYPDGRLEDGGRVIAAGPGAWDDLIAVVDGEAGGSNETIPD
jgi:myo-inositol-1(or 4)-monophosphatase